MFKWAGQGRKKRVIMVGIKNPNTIRVYTDRGRGIVSRNGNIIEDGINKKYKMKL